MLITIVIVILTVLILNELDENWYATQAYSNTSIYNVIE